MSDLVRRQRATQATLDKYRHLAFDWRKGVTCAHMARFHLRQMGHTPPTLPRIRSAIAARRELNARGWENVAQMLDTMLERIPPARMMIGDLAVLPSDEGGIGAIFLCAGHKLLGWSEAVPHRIAIMMVQPHELEGVWRA